VTEKRSLKKQGTVHVKPIRSPLKNLTIWIDAVRPRTLPLALSSTILGSFLAAAEHRFNWSVFLLASLTTIMLQILSNLANDYGDFVNGKDTSTRIGPKRMVHSGHIAPEAMVRVLIILVGVTLMIGTALIVVGTQGIEATGKVFYFLLGVAAIAAALKYTVGKNPYGYRGLGDIFVFLFFGLTGAIGTYFLHTHHLKFDLVLPATSIGLLSTGVLNLNNMRDIESDRLAKKRTLVVIMGADRAKIYHMVLLVSAVITGLAYTVINFRSGFQLLFLIALPLLVQNIRTVLSNTRPVELNAELKNLSLSTLLFSLAFGIGLLIG
jgi:1,4-dihydroxy-2-naphthoate polyprenyltransferase